MRYCEKDHPDLLGLVSHEEGCLMVGREVCDIEECYAPIGVYQPCPSGTDLALCDEHFTHLWKGQKARISTEGEAR